MDIKEREEIIKKGIHKLLSKYEDYRKTSGIDGLKKLSEADIRKDFINPLFESLGWNVEDSREYDAERYIRGGGFVDLAILVDDIAHPGEKIPKVFIEAKKIGKIDSINERGKQSDPFGKRIVVDWMPEERQVLNYCAKERIKWAVLTNFEKFRVFNAFNGMTILDIDSPSLYLERIGDLSYLSKESVYSGRIEELETREERPDIDEGFLQNMESWRNILASNIYEKNKSLSIEQVKEATQRILDRFVIIRSAEDRLILDSPDLLKDTYEYWSKHSEFGSLSDMLFGQNQIFHNFDKLYNSKIFERGHICEKVSIDDKVLGSIISGLYLVNFRKFSSDILGSTYESYLGGSFVEENGRLAVKSSMETRKSSGIYYTPRYIVDYIVNRTISELLDPLWNETVKLVNNKDFKGAEQKFSEISEVKVLDPSMGSGTFLISAFSVFQSYYEKYNKLIQAAGKEILNESGNDIEKYNHLPQTVSKYHQKILTENIYGIDLDPQATEICAVNLMLQALERGEKLPLILEENIKSGNSLIPGKVDRTLFSRYREDIAKLIQTRRKLRESTIEEVKNGLLKEEASIKSSIIMELKESLKMGDKFDSSRPFFVELEFPEVFFKADGNLKENPGFSCVIGNPPYGADLTNEEKKYINDIFSCTTSGNSAEYFLEQGINLAKEDGIIGMIVPKTIAFYNDWRDIRSLIIKKNRLTHLMDVGLGFLDVNYEELVLIFRKGTVAGDEREVSIDSAVPLKIYHPRKKVEHLGAINRELMGEATTIIFKPITNEEATLIKKISSSSYKFQDIFEKVFRGLYISDAEKKELKEGNYHFINKVPDVDRYEIIKVMDIDIESNDQWMKVAKEIMVPRIILKVMRGKRLVANFDDGNLLTTEKLVNVVLKTDTKYKLAFIVALFNSPLLSFYIEKVIFSGTTETSRVLDKPYIKDLPIKKIDFITPENQLRSSVEKFKEIYQGFLKGSASEMEVLGYIKRLLDDHMDDVVHDILALLAEQMVILKRERKEIYEVFRAMIKKFEQDSESRKLMEYVNLATIRRLQTIRHIDDSDGTEKKDNNYSIDLLATKELIDYKQQGRVSGVDVTERNGSLVLKVITEPKGNYKEMLIIPIKDDLIRRYFLLSIKLNIYSNPNRKFWSKNKVFDVLDTISIPRSVNLIEKDTKNIKALMEAFYQRMVEVIGNDFKESLFPIPDVDMVERAISSTDKLIDLIIYQVYRLTPPEQEIIENFAR